MASFVQAVMRLIGTQSNQAHAHVPDQRRCVDEEQGDGTKAASLAISSTLGAYTLPQPHLSHVQSTNHFVPSDDLTLFRLMVGINTSPDLAQTRVRPAENIGLYARVVNSEQKAKDSYKVMSAVINACYGAQIIVAAALTSLGAANADNKAITAFGAINTIIAGFLTYLKGSGLPGRLKYFGNEWKKVREFIEQRERDFSYEGCTLDVYEVVKTVREMYEKTKRDIELNTPESYNSVSSMRNIGMGGPAHGVQVPGVHVDPTKAEEIASKLRSLEETIKQLRARAQKTAHDVHGETMDTKSRVEQTAHEVHDAAAHTIYDEEKRATAELRHLGKSVMEGLDDYRDRRTRDLSQIAAQASPGLDVSVRVSPGQEDKKNDEKHL
ncbi:hypothetical protein N656DRAFT_785712 [Canariomyces notabilis]|uniref:SMODS and SLOG-associating 2TM effector domain-containing protein n=1 Tax=Canariomyces notabilis TaxID=2074819 RepID=A0AAN6QCK5_9PEZI|nr:hypothetical protein N656DRAFT_785712 [Canariomyces arenarius]